MGLDITYGPQTTIKSQALVDFVVKWTETQQPPAPVTREHWNMYFDDSFAFNGGKGRSHYDLPKGGLTPLHDSATFSHHKQLGGI
jgi:hypothetical protein